MFTNREFVIAQQVINLLPVEFPQSAKDVLTLLENNLMVNESSMAFVAEQIRASQFYIDLQAKLENRPAEMTEEDIICYALGTAKNTKELETVLTDLAKRPALTDKLTNPANFIKWFNCVPRIYRQSMFQFYWETERYKDIHARNNVSYMKLSPQEFFFVLFEMHYHVTKVRRKDKDFENYLGLIIQYLQHAETAFEFACNVPQYYLLRLACDLHIFGSNIAKMAADWVLAPQSDVEIALHAMFARDVRKINAARLQDAIRNLKSQYKGDDNVIRCLKGLEATAAFANADMADTDRSKALCLAAKDRNYINLASADLVNLNLAGANLEFAFVVPEKLDLKAKWRQLDEASMKAAGSSKYIWKDVDAAYVVSFDGSDLSNTRLPFCMGLTQVSLRECKLMDSSIFEFPLLCPRFRLNHSLFETEAAEQKIPYLNSQLTNVQKNIERMLNAPLNPPYAYVAKVDKEDRHNNIKSKHVAVKLVALYISAAEDEETAKAIYDAAMSHSLIVHQRKLSAMANKSLLFILPRKLDFLDLTHFSDSQKILISAMEQRKYLLEKQDVNHELLQVN